MPGLRDIAIRRIRPSDKAYKIYDSQGLFLLVHPSGRLYWRMRYKFAGRENAISLGAYPEVSLSMAWRRCDEERQRIAEKIDPAAHKKIQKIAEELAQATTFSSLRQSSISRRSWRRKPRTPCRRSNGCISLPMRASAIGRLTLYSRWKFSPSCASTKLPGTGKPQKESGLRSAKCSAMRCRRAGRRTIRPGHCAGRLPHRRRFLGPPSSNPPNSASS